LQPVRGGFDGVTVGILAILILPVCLGVSSHRRIRLQHECIGVLGTEEGEPHLVPWHQLEVLAAKRALDGLAGDLLPPGPRLLILHQEVLVVDARESEPQCLAVHDGLPHQPGVAERSISGDDGWPPTTSFTTWW
jgi:hypothetical protein